MNASAETELLDFKNTHCRASLKSNVASLAANCSKNPNLERYLVPKIIRQGRRNGRRSGPFLDPRKHHRRPYRDAQLENVCESKRSAEAIFHRETWFAGNFPIDPYRSIIPHNATLTAGRIVACCLIHDLCFFFERDEPMRKSFGYPELPSVGRGKQRPHPFSKCRRMATDVHGNVPHRSSDHPHKFSLCIRCQSLLNSLQSTY